MRTSVSKSCYAFVCAAGFLPLMAAAALSESPAPDDGATQTERAPLPADTPSATVSGNTFVAPVGWFMQVTGPATILEAPEGDSRIVLVDVKATDADAAVAAAWAAYDPEASWPLMSKSQGPDRDGWHDRWSYIYQVSPDLRRDVMALPWRHGDQWTVVIYDMSQPTGEKRLAQVALIFSELLPEGEMRESFAGRTAAKLDAARLEQLSKFVEDSMRQLGVPGVAVGVVQDGKVVLAEGYGIRELGRSEKVDANTRFMIASNTKALTTLMLATLVDEGKISWETPVTALLPSFRLGDPDTTKQVRVKHLICACTGLPRQDLESRLEFEGLTAVQVLNTLGTMQPTSAFGELFQYSNPMAAAAGFVGGHVAYPEEDLDKAYDDAMQTRVFDALGMTSTTFDYAVALSGNHAMPHAPDVDGRTAKAVMEMNYSVIPKRPAGGAWSNVHDMLAYVQMELGEGLLPDGTRYIGADPLLERRVPQVAIGNNASYGMGLVVDSTYGVPVVYHGGDLIGFHSDMMWLPEHNVGAVVLTNGDPGWIVRNAFQRRLLEVLFDGRPLADAQAAAAGKAYYVQLAAERRLLTAPANSSDSEKLAPRYVNEALGGILVQRDGAKTIFDFGEWRSEVASRKNPDGTTSFLTIAPGVTGFEFVVGGGPGRTLILRDAQHEYVFRE